MTFKLINSTLYKLQPKTNRDLQLYIESIPSECNNLIIDLLDLNDISSSELDIFFLLHKRLSLYINLHKTEQNQDKPNRYRDIFQMQSLTGILKIFDSEQHIQSYIRGLTPSKYDEKEFLWKLYGTLSGKNHARRFYKEVANKIDGALVEELPSIIYFDLNDCYGWDKHYLEVFLRIRKQISTLFISKNNTEIFGLKGGFFPSKEFIVGRRNYVSHVGNTKNWLIYPVCQKKFFRGKFEQLTNKNICLDLNFLDEVDDSFILTTQDLAEQTKVVVISYLPRQKIIDLYCKNIPVIDSTDFADNHYKEAHTFVTSETVEFSFEKTDSFISISVIGDKLKWENEDILAFKNIVHSLTLFSNDESSQKKCTSQQLLLFDFSKTLCPPSTVWPIVFCKRPQFITFVICNQHVEQLSRLFFASREDSLYRTISLFQLGIEDLLEALVDESSKNTSELLEKQKALLVKFERVNLHFKEIQEITNYDDEPFRKNLDQLKQAIVSSSQITRSEKKKRPNQLENIHNKAKEAIAILRTVEKLENWELPLFYHSKEIALDKHLYKILLYVETRTKIMEVMSNSGLKLDFGFKKNLLDDWEETCDKIIENFVLHKKKSRLEIKKVEGRYKYRHKKKRKKLMYDNSQYYAETELLDTYFYEGNYNSDKIANIQYLGKKSKNIIVGLQDKKAKIYTVEIPDIDAILSSSLLKENYNIIIVDSIATVSPSLLKKYKKLTHFIEAKSTQGKKIIEFLPYQSENNEVFPKKIIHSLLSNFTENTRILFRGIFWPEIKDKLLYYINKISKDDNDYLLHIIHFLFFESDSKLEVEMLLLPNKHNFSQLILQTKKHNKRLIIYRYPFSIQIVTSSISISKSSRFVSKLKLLCPFLEDISIFDNFLEHLPRNIAVDQTLWNVEYIVTEKLLLIFIKKNSKVQHIIFYSFPQKSYDKYFVQLIKQKFLDSNRKKYIELVCSAIDLLLNFYIRKNTECILSNYLVFCLSFTNVNSIRLGYFGCDAQHTQLLSHCIAQIKSTFTNDDELTRFISCEKSRKKKLDELIFFDKDCNKNSSGLIFRVKE